MPVKSYVDIFSSLLTPVVAILTVYIAWQQYQINNSSLKNALYERRLKVFNAFTSFVADVAREGKTNYQRVGQFYAEASEALFLFDSKVTNKLEELYQEGVNLVYLGEQLYPPDGSSGLPVGVERSEIVHEQAALLRYFNEQIREIRELFEKQMKMK